jgi:micrococcal nuclease
MRVEVVTVIAVVGLLSTAACSSNAVPIAGESVVIDHVDGDTVVIRVDGHDEDVRLIGIDTPETKHPTKPVECFGPEASTFMAALLPKGTAVRLERDVEARDRFGRLLAYVFRADDGVFVNLELARNGLARPLEIPPNDAHASALLAATHEARSANRGLWQACEQRP